MLFEESNIFSHIVNKQILKMSNLTLKEELKLLKESVKVDEDFSKKKTTFAMNEILPNDCYFYVKLFLKIRKKELLTERISMEK